MQVVTTGTEDDVPAVDGSPPEYEEPGRLLRSRLRYNSPMQVEGLLAANREGLEALCRKYAVKRLRLFGSALREDWNPETSDLDFLAEFGPPVGMNAFDRFMGFVLDLEALFGRQVDVVDWNAAKNPFFRRHAERSAKDLYAA